MVFLTLTLLSALSWGSFDGQHKNDYSDVSIPLGDVFYAREYTIEGAERLVGLLSEVDRAVAFLHREGGDVARWLETEEITTLIAEDAALRKYILKRKTASPIPPHLFSSLKGEFQATLASYKALSRSIPQIFSGIFNDITEDRYFALHRVVMTHQLNQKGALALIPFLDVAKVGKNVKLVGGAKVGGMEAEADQRTVLQHFLKYRAFRGEGDCYPVSLQDRWGEKVPSGLPTTACLGGEELSDELVRSIGVGTMSDAKITLGCGDKATMKEMFHCVGTADFEKKVYKKGTVLFKNELGRFFGDDFDAKKEKVPSPLRDLLVSQRELLQQTIALLTEATKNVDSEIYKEIAEEKKKAQKEKDEKEKEKEKDKGDDKDDDEKPKKKKKKAKKSKDSKKDKEKDDKKKKKNKKKKNKVETED